MIISCLTDYLTVSSRVTFPISSCFNWFYSYVFSYTSLSLFAFMAFEYNKGRVGEEAHRWLSVSPTRVFLYLSFLRPRARHPMAAGPEVYRFRALTLGVLRQTNACNTEKWTPVVCVNIRNIIIWLRALYKSSNHFYTVYFLSLYAHGCLLVSCG